MILSLLSAAWAAPAPPPIDLAEELRRERKLGIGYVAGGLVAAGGGVAIMSVGRGDPADISEETLIVSDLRSAGGAALLVGGVTATIIGASHLAEARSLRREQERLSVSIGWSSVALTGRF